MQIDKELLSIGAEYARTRKKQRAKDTRHKIQIGGLIIKAELDHESSALLYGLLLDAKERLQNDEHNFLRKKWEKIGAEQF